MFFNMAKTGNYAQAEEVISSKAKGLAGSVRSGDLSDEKVDAYKASFATVPQYVSSRNMGTGIQVLYRTVSDETATFLVGKEGTDFVIKEFKLTAGKGH